MYPRDKCEWSLKHKTSFIQWMPHYTKVLAFGLLQSLCQRMTALSEAITTLGSNVRGLDLCYHTAKLEWPWPKYGVKRLIIVGLRIKTITCLNIFIKGWILATSTSSSSLPLLVSSFSANLGTPLLRPTTVRIIGHVSCCCSFTCPTTALK